MPLNNNEKITVFIWIVLMAAFMLLSLTLAMLLFKAFFKVCLELNGNLSLIIHFLKPSNGTFSYKVKYIPLLSVLKTFPHPASSFSSYITCIFHISISGHCPLFPSSEILVFWIPMALLKSFPIVTLITLFWFLMFSCLSSLLVSKFF
jgi:hypothetical protein